MLLLLGALASLISCQPEPVQHEHTPVALDVVEPTCTATGKIGGVKCVTCGQMLEFASVLPAKGHSYSEEWTIDRESTDTEPGEKSHHCSECGARTAVTVIPRTAVYTYSCNFIHN